MYPRNSATPPRIYVGPVVQISDGAVQTSGVAVTVTPQGGSETGAAGTVEYSTKGGIWYTPTQAETNYTAFVVEASKTGCIPAGVTVVTTASDTAGVAYVPEAIATLDIIHQLSGLMIGGYGGDIFALSDTNRWENTDGPSVITKTGNTWDKDGLRTFTGPTIIGTHDWDIVGGGGTESITFIAVPIVSHISGGNPSLVSTYALIANADVNLSTQGTINLTIDTNEQIIVG